MKIQIFSEYYNLAQAGRVKPLACANHKNDHPAIFWLMHKMVEEQIMIYCAACGYEQTAGIQLYENILKEVKKATA